MPMPATPVAASSLSNPNNRHSAPRADYLTRVQALEILQVKPQTLYCYVSRGYIRKVPQPDGRSSFYLRDDVDKLKAKSAARAGHGAAAAAAMRWGEPVIQTSITDITPDGPRYRTRPVLDLARAGSSFETVAEYLWTGNWLDELDRWRVVPLPVSLNNLFAASAKLHADPHVLQLLALVAAWLGIAEGDRAERVHGGGTPVASARRLIRAMTGAFGILGRRRAYSPLVADESIAEGLARALGAEPSVAPFLDRALVLVADHELNPATFAARVAASGGADLHACIGAALDTHYGSLIGRGCDRIEQLLGPAAQLCEPAAVVRRVRNMLDTQRKLPGFNHVLYPHGDARASYLIELARNKPRAKKAMRNMHETLARLATEFDAHPSIEVGLVVLCRALALPDRTAAGLFALGRSAGWVAHVLEQRLAGFMIRPRAKFVSNAIQAIS